MPKPLIEIELQTYLITQLPSFTITYGDRPAAVNGTPTNLSTIYGQGGETEEISRFRIITRADDYETCLSDAGGIYDALHRKHGVVLTNFRLHLIAAVAQPEFIGHEEDGSFLASTDYTASFQRI